MIRLLVVFPLLLTGCYTNVQAPGAVGMVVDADTGLPVRHARITRPFIAREPAPRVINLLVPSEGIPATTVSSDKNGHFNLAPETHTVIRFMYLHNPKTVSGSFVISADGYATNELHGSTSHRLWCVDLGKVLLKKP